MDFARRTLGVGSVLCYAMYANIFVAFTGRSREQIFISRLKPFYICFYFSKVKKKSIVEILYEDLFFIENFAQNL